ncbi:hypothetical protein MM5_170 [Morganella phage vB_Mm5]
MSAINDCEFMLMNLVDENVFVKNFKIGAFELYTHTFSDGQCIGISLYNDKIVKWAVESDVRTPVHDMAEYANDPSVSVESNVNTLRFILTLIATPPMVLQVES